MKLFAGLVVASNAQGTFKCSTCRYSYDHLGVQLGSGDPDCLALDESNTEYLSECNPSGPGIGQKPACYSEFIADWMPNGGMQYAIRRGCRYEHTDREDEYCRSGGNQSSGLVYRDCVQLCYTDHCNIGNDRLFDLIAYKDESGKIRPPNECRSCSSIDLPETAEQCKDDPKDLDGGILSCPKYANAGCFNADYHKEGIGPNRPDESFYSKGCSPFMFHENGKDDYSAHCSSEGNLSTCKQTCNSDNCNIGEVGTEIQAPNKKCYTCSVTVDTNGIPIGWGDVECIEGALERHLEECGLGQDICVGEMEIDWRPSGLQTVTMRRGCANSLDMQQPTGSVVCDGINGSSMRRKICTETCNSDECNQDLMRLGDVLADNVVKSCKVCQAGQIIIDENGDLHDCAEDEVSQECPSYLTAGCYSARSTNSLNSDTESLTTHGCSAFEQPTTICTNFDTTGTIDPDGGIHGEEDDELVHWRVCKETCATDDCNDSVIDVPVKNDKMCFVCTQKFDQTGETIGYGDIGCWKENGSINPAYMQVCPDGFDYCAVDMYVDWTLRGHQEMTVRRTCSNQKPASEPSNGVYPVHCVSGDLGNGFEYKDCRQEFVAKVEEPTNGDISEVESQLGGDKINSCHTCYDDGLRPNPFFNCQELPTDETKMECPVWARRGCFKTVSEHYEDNHKLVTETIRGCSTFDWADPALGGFDHEASCNGARLDEDQYEVCKQTCSESNNCNNRKPEVFKENLKCFVCEETKNHLGETIGFSDTGCFDRPDEVYLQDCGDSATQCSTVMEIDWTPLGSQIARVSRSCGRVENNGGFLCETGDLSNFKYHRCQQSTTGSGSNDNLDIAELFSHGNQQERCYACSHNTLLDGEDDGNCLADDHEHHQDEGRAQRCPVYANAGCFTADNIHTEMIDGEDQEVIEVHRGCSTWITDNSYCAHWDYNIATHYVTCRDTCTSDGRYACNVMKYPEEEEICGCPNFYDIVL